MYIDRNILDNFLRDNRIACSEIECLNFVNVAPLNFHQNSWAFIHSFRYLMKFLDSPLTTGVLFSLFPVKDVEKGKWVSLSSQPGRKFSSYSLPISSSIKTNSSRSWPSSMSSPFSWTKKVISSFPYRGIGFQKRSSMLTTSAFLPMTKLCPTSSLST